MAETLSLNSAPANAPKGEKTRREHAEKNPQDSNRYEVAASRVLGLVFEEPLEASREVQRRRVPLDRARDVRLVRSEVGNR